MTDDDFTELVDANIPRVDLVDKAANGTRFLIAKAADDGLLQPLIPREMVADLIAKADAQEGTVTQQDGDRVAKADLDVADAPQPDDLIPDAPGGSTANSLPGSADWEQLDGDTAMNAVATLGRVKACLGWLANREAQEAVTGDDSDSIDNAWDLDDAACQLDWIIGRLAAFAVGEHMEADGLEQVGKAAAELTAPLAVVEKLAPVVKAGRMLSAANESTLTNAAEQIEQASQSIRGILAALPQAPTADDVTKETAVPALPPVVVEVTPKLVTSDGEPIEKGTDLAEALLKGARTLTAVDVFRALLAGGQKVDVTKAKGDPQMAVFSADGKLVGVIDPADLNPIAATEAPAQGDTEGSGDQAPADDAAPAADDAAAPAAPAAADDSRQIPDTDTVQAPPQAPDDTQTPAVAKTADPAQLEERMESLTKQLAELVADNTALKETVRKYGLTPDDRNSPHLNGANGAAGVVTRDGQGDDFADLRKAVADTKPGSPQWYQAQQDLNLAQLRTAIEAARR